MIDLLHAVLVAPPKKATLLEMPRLLASERQQVSMSVPSPTTKSPIFHDACHDFRSSRVPFQVLLFQRRVSFVDPEAGEYWSLIENRTGGRIVMWLNGI
jgi:hypothetical protein